MKSHSKLQEAALVALRLVVAAIFVYAGQAKWAFWSAAPSGMPAAVVNLLRFLSVVEPLGGVALVAGFLTRWAAAGLGIIMVGAVLFLRFTMQVGFFTTPQQTGLDYNLLILGGCLALLAFGGGNWSVDALRKKFFR